MTKADIVDQNDERTGLTKKDVAETVDSFLNAVAKALANGHHIEIRGFGTFRVKDRRWRIGRNPRTGEAVPVPPRKVPVFKVSKELKDMVSQGGPAKRSLVPVVPKQDEPQQLERGHRGGRDVGQRRGIEHLLR